MPVQYWNERLQQWRYLDGIGGPSLPLDVVGDIIGTPVIPEAEARGLRWCRVVSVGGDGVASPEIGHLALLARVGGGTAIPVTPSPPTAPSDWSQLIADLGGDSAVPFFYDFRFNVTTSGGSATGIDDVRGASGFGPFLGFGFGTNVYDAAVGSAAFTASDVLVSASPFAGVDLSGPFTLVYIGTVDGTGVGSQFVAAAGTPGGAPTTVLGIRADGGDIAGEALSGGVVTTVPTTVACDPALVRVCIVQQDGAVDLTATVPNAQATTTMAGGAMTATSAHIALMERTNADFANRGEGTARALFGVNHVLSPSEIQHIVTWAMLRRGATAA